MVHVSDMRWERVNKPSDILKIGDIVKVKVTEIDEKGRVNASMKELIEKPEGYKEQIRDYSNSKIFGGSGNKSSKKKTVKKEQKTTEGQ